MIQPHGGTLVNKDLPEIEKKKILGEINEFEKIKITPETIKVIKNIAFGVFSPLEGFMNENDTLNVLEHMYLEKNVAWPFPVTLDVSMADLKNINVEDQVILTNLSDDPIALLKIEDIYNYNKKEFAQKIFGTIDPKHPGVAKLFS